MAYTIADLEAELPTREMTDLVTEILASSLMSTGLFRDGIHTIAGLGFAKPPAPYYERWLGSSIHYLQQEQVLAADLTLRREVRPLPELWAEWDAKQPAWATSANVKAQTALLVACLRAVPSIVTGKQRATDVMFPNSSMELVEGIYRGNALADHFNEILGQTLTARIDQLLQSEPDAKIRIVEIGAGTGGTTARILPLLQSYPIAEYCYTDLSKAFLMYAEKQFQPEFPFLTTAIFDVSKPLALQSIPAGHYDFAIAANVLHATSDIRETLRNAKAVLKNQGVLLLNELSNWSLFNHLTFGLLEGWWLNEDAALRLPGCPALAPDKWQELLTQEGFEQIVFPAAEAHQLGQQIVAGSSDGWVRQRTAPATAQEPAAEPAQLDTPAAVVTRAPQPAGLAGQVAWVRQIIIDTLSESLKLDAAKIRNDAPFAEYGVDSIIGVNLVRTLNETLQIEMETISLFEHSTVDQLAQYIATNWQEQTAALVGHAAPATPREPAARAKEAPVERDAGMQYRFLPTEPPAGAGQELESSSRSIGVESIAIIGMSGRFAASETLDEFWQNLEAGKDLIGEVSRWKAGDCVASGIAGEGDCSRGSFIDSFDRFDPAFFRIPASEALYMEPQQRLFLEECWKALEDAGYAGKGVHETQCGVYVGCAGTSNYASFFEKEPPAHAFWGNSDSITPARVAYALDLQGPAIAVDTACSSALVSLHLACQGLWSRETDMALAGGVCVHATPLFYHVANRAHMLSPDGTCYSFDARANGFVPGEGVGVVVLKRLRDALRDGDYIHGVIAGSGINQDGTSNGLIAPNGRAQERLERSVYDRFEIDPETIQVIEAHGTGTLLGDSIEYGAITRSFREYTDRKQFCAIGTVKTNIGHTGGAAGVAGVLKLLLALKHRQIPPSLHYEKGSPAINFESSPFYVNTELQAWRVEDGRKRRAAVSSFGFSGTNAHVVIEEAPIVARSAVESPGYAIVLSARTAEQLQQQASNLLAHLKRTPDLSFNDLSFTLFVGRMHLAHRLSCIARDQEELIARLERWVETGAADQVFTSEIQEGKIREHVALKRFGNYCIQECKAPAKADTYLENLAAIADLYVQGYVLDYQALFPAGSGRMPLPTYPFARERYWFDSVPVAEPSARPVAAVASVQPVQQAVQPNRSRSGNSGFISADQDLQAWLVDDLSQLVAEILTIEADAISTDSVLMDLGFDSIGLTKFADAINERYQVDLTPVLFFEYPSISTIATYLSTERASEVRRASATRTVVPPRRAAAGPVDAQPEPALPIRKVASASGRGVQEPIAIVGISGVMPESADLDEFWENLKSTGDMITVIPADRWRWEDYYGDPAKEANVSNSKWGGFMKEVDKFDALFFGISPREAQMMDPQQRIFLETVWKAIEDSGQRVSDLSGTKTGVFVGVGSSDYAEVLRGQSIAMDGYSAPGNLHSVLANRVSFLLNLNGPSSPIDTACSSSLVALHRAVESMRAGSCDQAIVGGVQVMLSPGAYIAFGVAGMLSADGQCRTFDKGANGYVRGEGCGAIVLKPLSTAEADGNPIYAVIRATAENHGGRVTTLTAPNPAAQAALLIGAYEDARIDPATVGYIECHGTGTSLGDPIEVQALSKAFAELYKRSDRAPAEVAHCALSSVKTHIGHLEIAAGIAGVLTVLLAIKHRQIPANSHFEAVNPYINLKGTPFYIAERLTEWEAPRDEDGASIPRRAGVSSFGLGGSNAHIVLEEYIPAPRQAPAANAPQLIVVSAKNAQRLEAYVRSMHAHLEKHEVELADFAYTLQVGRDEMQERLALVVSSTEELKQKLAEILDGAVPEGSYRDSVRKPDKKSKTVTGVDQSLVEPLIEARDLSKLAELWVRGAKIDWSLLWTPDGARRIALPTYPFARERHWVPLSQDVIAAAPRAEEKAAERLQSLLPVWNSFHVGASKRVAIAETARIVLLGGDRARLEWVRTCYPNAQLLPLAPGSSIDVLEKALLDYTFDQLLWIAPDVDRDRGADDERILEQQEEGVLAVFRLIKALLRSGHGSTKLQWTVVTSMTQRVNGDDADHPAHAGVIGLMGSLAQEYPHWDIRVLDVDSLAAVTARDSFSLPWDKQGNALAHRRGEWFQQALELLTAAPAAAPVYRQNGVYVVIGGAGGVGEVWSRYMIEHYQASLVWIGRSPAEAALQQKLDSLARLGPAPLYIQADATNLEALEQARQAILKTYPAIHGVVHSAIVLDAQSLARIDEAAFSAGYSAKADISVNMDTVFGAGELDFMLFFSSIVSFFKWPGQCNYAAGCTFKDSFAHKLQQERAYPVKIMNWGYWGSVGIRSDETRTRLLAQRGLGSIEPDEGMAALAFLVGSELRQLALIKTLPVPATASLTAAPSIAYYPKNTPAVLPRVQRLIGDRLSGKPVAALEAEVPTAEMLDFITEIFASSLASLGLFSNGIRRLAELPIEEQPASYYERWVSRGASWLQQQNVLNDELQFSREIAPLAELWAEWPAKRTAWTGASSLQALVTLLEACLRALPDILTARQLATNVMFPNSSMELVEGVYRDNAVSDHFNGVLVETLVACIEQQLQAEPGREIRILEIGAGTGGTTAKILPALQRLPIAEYCYTDLSRAFLMHAEKNYRPGFPALTTAVFDVSKPIASQSVAADHYDFAIAANVLHATHDIRETLRNAKATLRNQGVLLLNEVSVWSLFNHLTFGLLEGWWLHDDTAVRMPGSPGLTPEKWQSVLAEEGFETILFPAEAAHQFGFQIVAAASNGWVRQRVPAAGTARPAASAGQRAGASSSRAVREYVQQVVNEKLSEALKLDASQIGSDAPLGDYGVDSISGVMLIRAINETLAIEVEPSTLLDYSTVGELTEYIVDHWQEHLSALLAEATTGHQESAPPETYAIGIVDKPIAASIANAASDEQVLESVFWEEASLADGYEKVTF